MSREAFARLLLDPHRGFRALLRKRDPIGAARALKEVVVESKIVYIALDIIMVVWGRR